MRKKEVETNEGMMKLEFRGLNTVVEVHYYKSPMGGSRSEPTRYRYSIGYRFDLVMMFKNKPFLSRQCMNKTKTI